MKNIKAYISIALGILFCGSVLIGYIPIPQYVVELNCISNLFIGILLLFTGINSIYSFTDYFCYYTVHKSKNQGDNFCSALDFILKVWRWFRFDKMRIWNYELYDGTKLLQQERMDFQTHLYELGELEPYLREIGFTKINIYSSYDKKIAENNLTEMFLYECSFW